MGLNKKIHQTTGKSKSQIKASNVKVEMRTLCSHDTTNSHVDAGKKGDTYRGLRVLSLASDGLLFLGYQPSPVTPKWSSRAVVLFHYHRGSHSMERRHHYPSGLMRLSHCRKGQTITAGAVFSLQTHRGWRKMGWGGGSRYTQSNKQSHRCVACMFCIHVFSLLDGNTFISKLATKGY